MVFITAEICKNAGVDVTPDNETNSYFWVKVKDVENGLGIKNMPYYISHKMCGIFEINNFTEDKKKQYVRSKNEINKNLKNNLYIYSRSDITEQMIKNCRGVKKVMMV